MREALSLGLDQTLSRSARNTAFRQVQLADKSWAGELAQNRQAF
jgi:hypothetical protein